MSFDTVKDSGERRDFGTGSVRDQAEGKGRYDLLEPYAIRRLAQHFENGAKKYGDNNWKLGQPLSVYLDSGIRHGFNLLEGKTDEDHAAAMAWNAMAFISTKRWVDEGKLPAELDDIEWDAAEPRLSMGQRAVLLAALGVAKPTTSPTNFFDVKPSYDDLLLDAIEFVADFAADQGDYYWLVDAEEVLREQHPEHWEAYVLDAPDRAKLRRVYRAIRRLRARPASQSGDRVSVRQITKAIGGQENSWAGTLLDADDNPMLATFWLEHEEIVGLLDKLEDAGYQITKI